MVLDRSMEEEIVSLYTVGYYTSQIAHELNISEATVVNVLERNHYM